MKLERISNIPGAPPALGPYSPAIIAGDFLFVSGQTPYDPREGKIVRGSIAEQTRLVLENLRIVLAASGCGPADVVSCRIYLQPLNDDTFREMNAVFAEFFGDAKPTRTTIGCQLLNMDVEVDAVALVPR